MRRSLIRDALQRRHPGALGQTARFECTMTFQSGRAPSQIYRDFAREAGFSGVISQLSVAESRDLYGRTN